MTGIDYSKEAVAFARRRYSDKRLRFLKMDAQQMSLPDASFDFVFSSENLEHLPDPRANVSEIRRVLRPGGIALIATPNKEMFSPGEEPRNPYHIKEFYFEEMRDLLKEFFREAYIFENSLKSPFELGRQMKQQRVGAERSGSIPSLFLPPPLATTSWICATCTTPIRFLRSCGDANGGCRVMQRERRDDGISPEVLPHRLSSPSVNACLIKTQNPSVPVRPG